VVLIPEAPFTSIEIMYVLAAAPVKPPVCVGTLVEPYPELALACL